MDVNKRLVFTATSGRSGTKYLMHLLKGIPGVSVHHEPKPAFESVLPEARHNSVLATEFLLEKKLPYINAQKGNTYVETSHYFCKGYADPLLALGIVPDLVLLHRDPRKVASSWFLIGEGMRGIENGQYHKHMIGPNEPNFLPAEGWKYWNDYQLCYWYALETNLRMRHYAKLIASHGGRVFETEIQKLATGDDCKLLLEWLKLPPDVVAKRVADRAYREKRINDQEFRKNKHKKQKAFQLLDLDTLEQRVRENCRFDEVMMQYLMQPIDRLKHSVESRQEDRIFVNIASFRDPEIQETIDDLFANAARPEDVRVGVCLQVDPVEDAHCMVSNRYNDKVRICEFHYSESKGANWARKQAFSLWKGEYYVLHIDSHMRFAKGWDKDLISMLKRCPTKKAVLSTFIPRYTPKLGKIDTPGKILRIRIRCFGQNESAQYVHLAPVEVPVDEKERGGLYPTPFAIAGFMFCRAEIFRNIPFDPYIRFWGDEITYAARLWTHGVDIYQPDKALIWHYWWRDDLSTTREEGYRSQWTPEGMRSYKRVRHLLGFGESDDAASLVDIEKYGLGTQRKLEDLWEFAGIRWSKRWINRWALEEGRWNMEVRRRVITEEEEKFDRQDIALKVNFNPVMTEVKQSLTKTFKPQIFVNIASFRDPEIQATIDDLFANATYPDRIRVGVCLQVHPSEDEACRITNTYDERVSIRHYAHKDSKGANWARSQAQQLWKGEDYVLQIDSHMRFEKGWDETLIGMLQRCPSQNAVLSTYVPRYTPDEGKEDLSNQILRLRIFGFAHDNGAQLLHLTRIPVGQNDKERRELYSSPFYIANFMFCRSNVLTVVPFDPYIQFWGDEITYAARLWTHGFDIYQPNQTVVWHYWRRDELVPIQGYRKQKNSGGARSALRIRHLLGFEKTDDALALEAIENYGLGTTRELDELWAFAGIDWAKQEISKNALEGKWDMAARQKAITKETRNQKSPVVLDKQDTLPRIFVQIASYRDPDCQNTVKDLFDKAAHPERIFVGICWQFVKEQDSLCFKVPYPYPDQVRVHEVNAHEGRGVCWARSLTQKLWKGEEFTLQIDSHMRFEQGWDDSLLATWKECENPKAVLTCYPPGFTPPDTRDRTWVFGMAAREFDADGIFTMHGKPAFETAKELPKSPLVGAFASANMLFGPGSIIEDVPYDPYLYFFGEEISVAVRLWTHGYDLYHPNKIIIFHDWNRDKRPTHFSDHKNWGDYNDLAYERVRHLLGTEISTNPAALQDIEKYGLGTERTLEEYQRYSGVDFAKKTISRVASEGYFLPYKRPQASKRENEGSYDASKGIFVLIPAYRDNECQRTVQDLFEKAAYPENIFVGICWQFDEQEDADCFRIPYPRPDQVRVVNYHYTESKGANWARIQALKLRRDEPYILMIDAHMRFAQDWDTQMLDMYSACASEKSVLTVFPAYYWLPDQLDTGHIVRMGYKDMEPDDGSRMPLIVASAQKVPEEEAPIRPFQTVTVAHGFIFARSEVFDEVPIDPHIYFFNDELDLAVRLWTSGWDLYSPNRTVLYHLWDVSHRRRIWEDGEEEGRRRHLLTRDRVAHLVGMKHTDNPEALIELDKYGLGTVRSIEDYQKFAGIDFAKKVIQPFADEGRFLPLPLKHNERKQPSAVHKRNAAIFVNIASYRDPECQWTVKDMFEKATNPDRIVAGICWQFDEKEDKHCFQVITRPEQVRVYPVDWREAEGVCWARYQAQQLWEDEEYTLMIDSHMRFVPGWDELLIEELYACDSDKPILSCSPAAYTPPNNLAKNPHSTIRRAKVFMPNGNIRCQGEALDRAPEHPLPAAFLVANFVFSRSDVIREVPYDPHLYFDQEEITYALRLYTHGWDIFSSRKQFLYHYYNERKPEQLAERPLHWDDLHRENKSRIDSLREKGMQRFNHLTGYQFCGKPEFTVDLHKFGLGQVRTLHQYQKFSGIDFRNKITTERAIQCQFIEDLKQYRARPIRITPMEQKHLEQTKAKAKPIMAPKENKTKENNIVLSLATPERIAPRKGLEVGDFIPFFELLDTTDRKYGVEMLGGKFTMLFFLPGNDREYLKAFFSAFSASFKEGELGNFHRMFIFDVPLDKAKALKQEFDVSYPFCVDPERQLAKIFAGANEEKPLPAAYVLNNNLRIISSCRALGAVEIATGAAEDCKAAFATYQRKYESPLTIRTTAPILIVENVLSPEMCRRCIEAFRHGKTFEGTVGAGNGKAYRPDNKVRTDYIINGKLLDEVDDRLSRSLFPEIKKVFGFEVTHRELYKVGMYDGEKKGFFRAHRDNFLPVLGYRRLAMTIHLNDEYEGGGLRFPEYDEHIYRSPAGSANIFSCATLHEARPVTKGERFVIVGFFHGVEEEAFRRHQLVSKNSALKVHDYTPVLQDYPEIKQSRDFFKNWQKEQVLYNVKEQVQPLPAISTENKPSVAVMTPSAGAATAIKKINLAINTTGKHQIVKVFESPQGIVFDNFLPEDVYQHVYDYSLKADYEYINTSGPLKRAWHLQDGFPLRGTGNIFYYAKGTQRPDAHYAYPTQTPLDKFADALLATQSQVEYLVGRESHDWKHFSITNWLYPHGTGLALHDDGSGVYCGAYAYFLNPTWKLHWGGLLLLMDQEGNRRVHEYRNSHDQMDFYTRGLLNASPLDDLLMESGFAQCIMPKRNRIVFIANDAYHMVTRVNEEAGDNIRMSIAGFYDRK